MHQTFNGQQRQAFLARETGVLKNFLNQEWANNGRLTWLVAQIDGLNLRGNGGDSFSFSEEHYFAGGHRIEDTGTSNATLERVMALHCHSDFGRAAIVKVSLSVAGEYTMLFSGDAAPLGYVPCDGADDVCDGIRAWLNALENSFGIPARQVMDEKSLRRSGAPYPDFTPTQW